MYIIYIKFVIIFLKYEYVIELRALEFLASYLSNFVKNLFGDVANRLKSVCVEIPTDDSK